LVIKIVLSVGEKAFGTSEKKGDQTLNSVIPISLSKPIPLAPLLWRSYPL
jgi:hypothetical protein